MIRAVAVAVPASVFCPASVGSCVAVAVDVFVATTPTAILRVVVVVDRNKVELPLGSSAVALTRTEETDDKFVLLLDDDDAGSEGMGSIENAADEDGVSGQTVATGTWMTVVGKL